jgi:hypothetical protein
MERPEIVELLFSALVGPNDIESLSPFLSQTVEWILAAADPQTGEESPSNAIKFSGEDGFRELTLYLRDRLNVISGDLTGCILHQYLFLWAHPL